MICPGAKSIGIPHVNVFLDIDKSCKPCLIKEITSFLREWGKIKSGCSSICFKRASAYLDILKKYDSSFKIVSSFPQSGHLLLPFSWFSGKNVSQETQYFPSYSPL